MKRDVSEEAFQAEIKRLSLVSTLGKPEALSGPVLTIRMIETIVQNAAQAAASRAATEALQDEIAAANLALSKDLIALHTALAGDIKAASGTVLLSDKLTDIQAALSDHCNKVGKSHVALADALEDASEDLQAIRTELHTLRATMKRKPKPDYVTPVLYGFGGAAIGGCIIGFLLIQWIRANLTG